MGETTEQYRSLLGVAESATVDEIKTAYRALALKHHPDKDPRPGAEERFRLLTRACGVLCGIAEARKSEPLADPDERRGANALVSIEASLEDMVGCARKKVAYRRWDRCRSCGGSGSESGVADVCAMCGGSGFQGMAKLLGTRRNCLYCDGVGRTPRAPKCRVCGGRGAVPTKAVAEVALNPRSEFVVVRGMGHHPAGGGIPGDLVAEVWIRPHKRFGLDGLDLTAALEVSPAQAVVGDDVEMDVLGRKVPVHVPAGTAHGDVVFVAGAGARYEGKEGGLRCRISIVVPKIISRDEEELYRRIVGLEKENQRWPRTLTF